MPRYALGLIHDHHAPLAPDLAYFATEPLPAPAESVAAPDVEWPMADNDTLGCCAIADGPVHAEEAWRAILGEPWTYSGDAAVRSTYLGLTGGQDTGLMLANVITHWSTGEGLLGSRIDGAAAVHPRNTTAVRQAIDFFGLGYAGVNLPKVAQTQFRPDGSGTWGLTGTNLDYDIEGGHCITLVGYDAEGNIIAVTWGSTVKITPAWWATYGTQIYALLPADFQARGGNARGLTVAKLRDYLPQLKVAA